MADSDNEIKMNVAVGVSGEEGIQTLNVSLAETSTKSADADEKSKLLEKTMGELDKITPGLGDAVNILASAYTKAGAAAKNGAVSFGSFNTALSGQIRALGPLTVVTLGIEAAMTYWDLYNEKVAEAAAKQAESLDKIRKSTSDALEEQVRFDEAMKKTSEPEDQFAESLGHAETIISAQTEAKRKLLKLNEDAELAQAKTPEEREAIQKRYDQKDAALSSSEESQKIDALAGAGAAARTDRDNAETEKAGITEKVKAIITDAANALRLGDTDYHDELLAKLPALNQKISELDKRIVGDRTKQTRYEAQADTQSEVRAINDDERLRASNLKVSNGTDSIEALAHGQKISQEQIKANQALTQLFAAHAGGIQQMQQIIKYHLEHSTTQAQEIAALKNALDGLQNRTAALRNYSTGT